MKKILKFSLLTCGVLTSVYAQEIVAQNGDFHSVRNSIKAIENIEKEEKKEKTSVDEFKNMFKNAKVSGEIKSIYGSYEQKKDAELDTYTTAVGGTLKYELASFKGFNAGVGLITSQDLSFATGDKNRQNPELSSSNGEYTELSEAYINYKYKGLNFRAGRQVIDTPLADSDEIRMIYNTFEAYIVTYEVSGFEFMAGNLQSWQGYDAGLDNKWSKAGENGTYLASVAYKSETINSSAWYYNISKSLNAIYIDLDMHYNISDDILIHTGLQFLNEKEIDNSGFEADIYGAMAKLSLYHLNLSVAYNNSKKKTNKDAFSGFGGGTLYTSMDTLIVNDISADRDVDALVLSVAYDIADWTLLYAYGDFDGGENSSGIKAHLKEQDIGIEYNVDEKFALSAVYAQHEDAQNSAKTTDDWNRIQIMARYSF